MTYTWDGTAAGNVGIGRLTSISDASGLDGRVFDSKGNIKTYYRTALPNPNPVVSSYSYDAAGNVIGMIYPSGRAVTFQRDTMGRIIGIVTYQTQASAAQTVASAKEKSRNLTNV